MIERQYTDEESTERRHEKRSDRAEEICVCVSESHHIKVHVHLARCMCLLLGMCTVQVSTAA